MISRTSSRNSRRVARSKMVLLIMIWTIISILNESRLCITNKNSPLSSATPIMLVEAVWYSEICHAGPRYKVKIDPLTGNVVPVYPEEYGHNRYNPFGTDSDSNDKSDSDSGDTEEKFDTKEDSVEGFLNGGAEFQRSNQTNNGETYANRDTTTSQTNNSDEDGAGRRALRSNRLWRDFDEDSETDAIVVSSRNKQQNDVAAAARSDHASRSLYHKIEEDLKPGEFYVKPCICQDSRWTFPDATDTTSGLPPTVYNETTDTLIQQPLNDNQYISDGKYDRDTIYHINPKTSPKNFGLLPNNQLTYISDGSPEGDLFLCRAQAMYCGVLMDSDSNFDPIVKCYDQNMRHIIARNAWPLILLWYFGLAVICCCTVHGRTAGDYVQDRLTYFCKKFVCCFFESSYDFNDRMLNRMIRDDERERRRRNGYNRQNGENDEDNDRPWYFSNQRLQFERSLMAQVQWIWRHQEYMREVNLREQGLPPPEIKLRVKRFRMETSTSNSKDGGFSKMPPPTSITIKPSSKEDMVGSSKQQQNLSVISARRASDTKKTESENGDGQQSGASTTTTEPERRPSNGSTCSSSSAENILINKDGTCCTLCPDDSSNTNDNRSNPQERLPLPEDEEEFATLYLVPDNKKHNDGVDFTEKPQASDVDSLDAPTCAICFCAFEEGDRIGDLSCKHEFHIDCLKGWVQRKNACPLCNVRLGKPERPLPPRQDESNLSENSIDGSRHSLSGLMQRLNGRRRNSNNTHSSRNNTNTNSGGEIQMGFRIGMIGAVSAAADIAEARERVNRRNGDGRS